MNRQFLPILILFLTSTYYSIAQKQGYIWISGHDSFSNNPNFGGITIDFNNDTLVVKKEDRYMDFGSGISACISTAEGQLLCYSNGCSIANYNNELIENGDSINLGEVFLQYCGVETLGYPSGFQSAIMLPSPESDSLIYLFHKRIFNTYNPFDVHTHFLLYSTIDMAANGGSGKVMLKNQVAYQDTLSFGEMTAVRHANGVDWWLMSPGDRNNKYFVFLFSQDGIHLEHTLAMGDSTLPAGEGGGLALFSHDGTKYIRFNPKNKIRMFDFDRGSGMLSNYQHIDVSFGNYDPFAGGCGLSPSGRFLYLAVLRYIYQVDLQAPDIAASTQLIGTWDGYADPLATNFYQPRLGPDCKLYVVPGNDTKAIHVIHNPDEPGLACNLEQHALHTPSYHGATFPNFPNFRLGALGDPVSPCAGYTINSTEPPVFNRALPLLSVFPNPAGAFVKLLPNLPLPPDAQWSLYDGFGRRVRTAQPGAVATAVELPLDGLPAGVYYWTLRGSSGNWLAGGKLAKQ